MPTDSNMLSMMDTAISEVATGKAAQLVSWKVTDLESLSDAKLISEFKAVAAARSADGLDATVKALEKTATLGREVDDKSLPNLRRITLQRMQAIRKVAADRVTNATPDGKSD